MDQFGSQAEIGGFCGQWCQKLHFPAPEVGEKRTGLSQWKAEDYWSP